MMKKMYVAALALTVSAMPLSGQGIELRGGLNLSSLSGQDITNAVREMGMNYGVGFNIPIAGAFGLGLGTDFSQKGVEVQNIVDGLSTISGVMDLSYIEIPLVFRVGLVGSGPVRLNLMLGPSFGFNTGCEFTEVLAGAEPDPNAAIDCANNLQGMGINSIKDSDIGGIGGLSLDFVLGGLITAGVNVQYNMGLTPIADATAGTFFDAAKNSTYTIQTHLGFDIF
ncbi:MAG: PorT family protein [Gemmatimonadota bacterium]|nr:PorT family protein [Gemmatimonadota bacterium]MDH5760963.1 PorT family protein [Gemmatimonadota bacterium]